MRAAALAGALWCAAGCATAPPSAVEQALSTHQEALRQVRSVEPGLALSCEPKDAEVLIDGVLQGRCEDVAERVLSLGEGPHRIEVRKAGHRSYHAQVEAGRARTRLQAQLVPAN